LRPIAHLIRMNSRILLTCMLLAVHACGSGGSAGAGAGAMLCGPYPAQAASPYVLPYPVGQSFVVGQGNCSSNNSHAFGTITQYAYDFLMPIGTPIVAARDGTVLLVEERWVDGNRTPGQENYINVTHADGSIAGYVHLTQFGALVAVGDAVRRGDQIGVSGDTGQSTAPHLHFHVQRCSGCETVALTFLNTRPHPNGLVEGQSYTAEAY
jgi:murein DD-endopeptidase MepM/ murein hydrolase activator NlpD